MTHTSHQLCNCADCVCDALDSFQPKLEPVLLGRAKEVADVDEEIAALTKRIKELQQTKLSMKLEDLKLVEKMGLDHYDLHGTSTNKHTDAYSQIYGDYGVDHYRYVICKVHAKDKQ